jgi:hypothetical protein
MSYYFWGRPDYYDGFIPNLNGAKSSLPGSEGPLRKWWRTQGGLIKALFLALAFEMVENTETIIDLFRENSGKIIKPTYPVSIAKHHFQQIKKSNNSELGYYLEG